jgi:hypothetical protein
MANKDPIPQEFIIRYVDQLIKLAESLPNGSPFRDAIILRADNVLDIIKAWQENQSGQ